MLVLIYYLALHLTFKHQANTLTSFSQVKPNPSTIAYEVVLFQTFVAYFPLGALPVEEFLKQGR